MLGGFTSSGCVGPEIPRLSLMISECLLQYLTSNVTVTTIDTGMAGSGVGIGILVPNIQSAIIAMTSNFAVFSGPMATPMAIGVATGLYQTMFTATPNTNHATVGIGTGVCSLIPNSGMSKSIFISKFESIGYSKQLANSISSGVDMFIPTVIGTVVIAGPATTSPSAGVGIGNLV